MVFLLLKWFFPPRRQTLPPVFYGTVGKDRSFGSAHTVPLRKRMTDASRTENSATGQADSRRV